MEHTLEFCFQAIAAIIFCLAFSIVLIQVREVHTSMRLLKEAMELEKDMGIYEDEIWI